MKEEEEPKEYYRSKINEELDSMPPPEEPSEEQKSRNIAAYINSIPEEELREMLDSAIQGFIDELNKKEK